MVFEIAEHLKAETPTHVFLQAGVGAMDGSITGFLTNLYEADCPIITVEPYKAAYIYRTIEKNKIIMFAI